MNSVRKLYTPASRVTVAKNSTRDKLKAIINKCVAQADTPIHVVRNVELGSEIDQLIDHMSIMSSTNVAE